MLVDSQIHQAPRRFPGDDVEVGGLAANDAAERYVTIVGAAGGMTRRAGHRDGTGNFKRTRHRNLIELYALSLQHGGCSGQQCIGQAVVKASLDNQDPGHRWVSSKPEGTMRWPATRRP